MANIIEPLKMCIDENIPTIATKARAYTFQLDAVVAKVNQCIEKVNDMASGNLPDVTQVDNNKILRVVNGQWELSSSLSGVEGQLTALTLDEVNLTLDVRVLQNQMNAIYDDMLQLGTLLQTIVTGDIGGE